MSGWKPYSCKKGNPIFVEGDPARFIGIILTGTAQVIREDYYGNRSVMTNLQPSDLFAEAFSCAGLSTVPVSVFAMTDSDILLLDCHHLLTSCSNSCDFHNTLIRNLLHEIARKNLALNQKIRYMSEKTTRDKLMAYLSDQAKQNHSDTFTIPFNRQALADYLGVERSAMSAEISKLKKTESLTLKSQPSAYSKNMLAKSIPYYISLWHKNGR